MRLRCVAVGVALPVWAPLMAFGQNAQALAISNLELVSRQAITPTLSRTSYRATLVNPGPARSSVAATVISTNPIFFRVVIGQDTLHFAPVPANSRVSSGDTITILADPAAPLDSSKLQWTFQATDTVIANAGPDQTVGVGSMVTLDGSGSTSPRGAPLTYRWAFTARPAGSSTTLFYGTMVNPMFVANAPGTYVIQLTVSDGVASSSASVKVSTANSAPVANAGPNQTVQVGGRAVLNGSRSTDVDGNALTYRWSLVTVPAGSKAALDGANAVSATFIADKPGTYIAQLIVNDGTYDSLPAQVTIRTQNSAPVATAGADQVVRTGDTVRLNGSGSTDVDGDTLRYQWSLIAIPPGSAAVLDKPAAVDPAFTVDLAGTYVAQLIVNDGLAASVPATVTIKTNTVSAPVSNAGPNQTVPARSLVTLAGSGTDPQGLPLTYGWSLIAVPAGSTAVLSSASIANPSFIADLQGTYIAQLMVSNGVLKSAPSTVTITTSNTAPVANAGINQSAAAGATVTLDGSGSGDADRNHLTYAWSFLSRPPGSSAVLLASNTAMPKFVIDVAGTYVAQLIVNDGFTNSAPATVQVTAAASGSSSGSSYFTPASLAMSTGSAQSFTLSLSAPAPPGGLAAGLQSSNSNVASVPAFVTFAAGTTGASVPVSGVAQGSATITANIPGFGNPSAAVTVLATQTASVVWHGACWQRATIYGITGNFQAIDFVLTTPAPIAVQGSLFFAPNCDASQGYDNMNDFNQLTRSTHMIQGFAHFPDVMPTSALYWVGGRTMDGRCPAGAPCSGCVNYTSNTPDCSNVP